MDEGKAFEWNAQAFEVVKPSNRALDDPSGFTKVTAMRFASASNLSVDARSV